MSSILWLSGSLRDPHDLREAARPGNLLLAWLAPYVVEEIWRSRQPGYPARWQRRLDQEKSPAFACGIGGARDNHIECEGGARWV